MELFTKIIIFGLPILLAITLHEAAHGYAALRYGDDTAKRLGRVSLNPFRHIDPLGTVILPGLLLLSGSPILFGYAKPVPVDFTRLNNPRRDSVIVAAAGPLTNIALAYSSALLVHGLVFFSPAMQGMIQEMLSFSIMINVMLAVFNMIPIPPLDGGRVAVGLLPNALAMPLARLEPYGMFLIFGLILIPYLLGISLLGWLLLHPVKIIIDFILLLAGLS